MTSSERFFRNIALCRFFHKRKLCHGNCINCPQEVMRTISFQTQGELFETVSNAILSSVSFLSQLEHNSINEGFATDGFLEEPADENANISEIMKTSKRGPSGFDSILIVNYLNEDVVFYFSQKDFVEAKHIKALTGLKIQIDSETAFNYLIVGSRKTYKYKWLYCGELEVDIFDAFDAKEK